MPIVSRRRLVWPLLAGIAVGATACTGAPSRPASGDLAGTSLVIAVPYEPATLHPLAGFAEHGAAKIFDGLVEHRADAAPRPALAAALPEPASDGKSWTARLRTGVTFSDGSAFDAQDVVATYRAMLDPAYASPVRDRFFMLTGVRQLDPTHVRFDLSQPYAPFLDLLVLGIVPSESLATPGPVTGTPPGTGPYRLAEWRHGQGMTFDANPTYFDGAPAIKKVSVEFIPDDEARAARMREGKLDGAALPPSMARTFESVNGLRVVTHDAADLNAILLPAGNPVTADPALRLALNYGINRKALVDGPAAGKGTEASTPVPGVLAEFVEPSAHYGYDVSRALDALTEAGWLPGPGGIRARGGVAASFSLVYPAGDTLARDLADAFATAARGMGVQVNPRSVAGGDLMLARTGSDAALAHFGNPFDPDLGLYQLLHTTVANSTIDTALDTGRAATDPAQRAIAYRKLQRAYLGAPTMIVLTAPQHTYVIRDNWNGYQPVTDADTVDFTWGAWWNLQKWTPK